MVSEVFPIWRYYAKARSVDFWQTHAMTSIDLSDPKVFSRGIPHAAFTALRTEGPISRQYGIHTGREGYWCVTRHADVVAANRDFEHLSPAPLGTMIFDRKELLNPKTPRMLIEMDPPQHTRYRRLVNRGFTPRMIAMLETQMRAVARTVSDRANRLLDENGEIDVVADIAAELPMQVIAAMLGIPEEDHDKMFALSQRIIGFDDPESDNNGLPDGEAMMQMYAYANTLGAKKREAMNGGVRTDDIVTALLDAEVDGEQLSELEFDLFFLLLVVAGNETTRTAIAQGIFYLFSNPDQWQRLLDDRSLVTTAVDEILRVATPIMYFRRTVIADTEIGGVAVAKGDRVVLWYASANFDEAAFVDPQSFDVGRTPNDHVTFGGGGPHFCLGANLARLEIRVMLEELLDQMPTLGPAGPAVRGSSNFTNGLRQLPARRK